MFLLGRQLAGRGFRCFISHCFQLIFVIFYSDTKLGNRGSSHLTCRGSIVICIQFIINLSWLILTLSVIVNFSYRVDKDKSGQICNTELGSALSNGEVWVLLWTVALAVALFHFHCFSDKVTVYWVFTLPLWCVYFTLCVTGYSLTVTASCWIMVFVFKAAFDFEICCHFQGCMHVAFLWFSLNMI